MCYVVNGPRLTLDFVRIFMLVNQLGSVMCELCACVYACVVVCLYDLLDGILMLPT